MLSSCSGVFNKFDHYGNNSDLYTYTDKDTIDYVVKMHQMVIERYKNEKVTETTEISDSISSAPMTVEEENSALTNNMV